MSLIIQKWFDRDFSPASGGPNNYAITADAGSYAISGQAATILKTRILTAAQGSYAYSGQAATIARGFKLTAAQGSYTYTGQAATLLKSKLLAAAAGSYSLSGQTASLLHSRLVTAANGSYTISGQDATVTYTPNAGAYTITANSGTYVITGISATLSYVPLATTQQNSGGYGFAIALEQHTFRHRQRLEEARRLEREAIENAQEDEIQAELAKRLHSELQRQQELDELQRLRLLVSKHSDLAGVPDAVQRAFLRARTESSFSRLQALQREFQKSLDEEEMALLMILLADG